MKTANLATPTGLRPHLAVLLLMLLLTPVALAQGPGGHAGHHPGGGPQGAPGPTGSGAPGAGPLGTPGPKGPGGMMDGMMEKMGAPKPKDLYPTLMSLPDLPPEKRLDVLKQASQRMNSGTALMGKGLDQLSEAAPREDYTRMQEGVAVLKEGLAQYDSGLAAKRALVEGKAPRSVAVEWFKGEMNLLPPAPSPEGGTLGGPSFHLFVILILGVFSVAMIGMYFFKMRRASDLLVRLSSGHPTASSDSATVTESTPPKIEEAVKAAVPASSDLATATESAPPEIEDAVKAAVPAKSIPAQPPEFPEMHSKTQPVEKWSGKLRVCQIFEENPGIKTFRLAAEHDVALPFTYYPGQFVTLALDIKGKKVQRSYTIASTPTQLHYCALTIKREDQGLVSRFLHDEVKEGDLLEVSGPIGKFTFTGDEAESIVLICGGVGITPMMGVIRYLTDIGWHGDIFLLYCCRTTVDFIFREELEQLQERHANLNVFATMTRAAGTVWMGLKGRFTAPLLDHLVPDLTTRRIHVCGPPGLMSAVVEMLESLKVPKELIKTEAFGPAKRPPAKPSEPPKSPKKESKIANPTVAFKTSGKSGEIPSNQTVLDVADEVGVDIDYSCRLGQCGLCKVKLLSGTVEMECEDSLAPEEKEAGLILACQAKASADIEVEA